MYKLKRQFLLLASFFFIFATSAQNAGITGKIIDKTGEALIGATVFLEATSNGTVTDFDGNYELTDIPPGTYNVSYSFIGYKKSVESVTLVAGQTLTKDMTLEEDALLLEEAVVIGYGTTQAKDLTGSVTSVSTKDFNAGSVTTPEQLITGKIAGVQITSNSGAPGSGSRIRIRGGTSLNASNDPLIVIDGVPVDNNGLAGAANALNLINPDDIENITVLKDASASAIYGSRGANGVVIITTKKGVAGKKLNVEFNTTNSFAQPTGFVDVLTADELRTVINENGTAGQQGKLGDANTDWQEEIYRTGITTDNNLTFSGGLEKLPYRLNLSYMMEQGILERSQLGRMGASLNISPLLMNGHLKVDANGKAYHTDNFFADQGAIGTAVTFDPTQPVFVDDQTYGGYFEWVDGSNSLINLAPKNPLGLLNQKDDESNVNRMIGNVMFDYKFHFLPDLHGVLNLGADLSRSSGTVLIPETAASSYSQGGSSSQYEQNKTNKLLDAYFNYVKEIKSISSRIDFTAGHSYQNWFTEKPVFPALNIAGDTITPEGIPFESENTLISFYGRLNYNLKERYLITATLREDGSSRFSPDTRWGLFPSVALAWRISEESFLKESGVYLKLRLGYGVTGQQDLSYGDIYNDYPYIPNYDSSTTTAQYEFGGEYYYLLRPDGYDPNIKWEETTSYNAGLDFGFAQDRISGTIDVYKKITDDLLATIPVPAGTNFTNQILTNVGSMENIGVEASLNIVAFDSKDMSVNVGINGTANTNEITNLTKVADTTSAGILVGGIDGGIGNNIQIQSVGYASNTFYAYQQVYDEDGNPIEESYVDQNGDSIINSDDLVWGENPTPDFYAGLNASFRYKKWSLSFSMRGEFGNYVYNNVNSTRGTYQNIPTTGTYLQNLSTNYLETEFQSYQILSDYYIEKATFIRMDYLNVGYNFGKVFSERALLNVSAVVQNVFVATEYSGLDPEIAGGIDKSLYPRPRIYSLNINLKI
ncbi:MAG: SusC/RagA family TonB-linked outer membrane protein [Chitinophagales bacterium]|nr:SusC/RagA family TonB-linked outer membrane protein [Chitinophagales bacterium]